MNKIVSKNYFMVRNKYSVHLVFPRLCFNCFPFSFRLLTYPMLIYTGEFIHVPENMQSSILTIVYRAAVLLRVITPVAFLYMILILLHIQQILICLFKFWYCPSTISWEFKLTLLKTISYKDTIYRMLDLFSSLLLSTFYTHSCQPVDQSYY